VQLERDLRTIGEDVEALAKRKGLSTTNPVDFTPQDIANLIGYWKVRPKRGPNSKFVGGTLDPTSQAHLFRALKGLLEFCGNGAIGQLKTMPWVEIPRVQEKPVDTLAEDDFRRLRAAAESICGWRGVVARFVVEFCPQTGLRPNELRLQEVACVDLVYRRVRVCAPKGMGRYAASHREYAVLGPGAEQALRDYLPEREKYLDGETHPALLPFRRNTGELDYWPSSSLRKLMADLRRISGVPVSLQKFRSTFGQRAIDNGASIEAVSRAMRHHSTVTTERYYARIRPERALDEVRKALELAPVCYGKERRRPDSNRRPPG